MNERELFERETAAWGGRLPMEKAPTQVRENYEEIAERANDLIGAASRVLPTLPPIHFDFIWNSRIDAVAFKADGRYFIGVHTGTLFMLRTVIGRILSDGRLFPQIGDPSREAEELPPLADYYPDAEEMLRTLALMTPADPVRRAYAQFLQDQAIMFFIGHELAHITRGHVAYLAKKGYGAAREIGIEAMRDESAILGRQGIEMDADGRSILSRIDSLRITHEDPTTPKAPWVPKAEGPGQLIHDWAVSMNILFRLFGDERFSGASLAQSSYPPLVLRRIVCNAAALGTIIRIWGQHLEAIGHQALLAAQIETDRVFDAILGARSTRVRMPEPDIVASKLHLKRIEEFWNTQVHPELRDLSFER